MKNNFGIKVMTYSYFYNLGIFIKLPKYYLKQFQYNNGEDAMKYFPKSIRLDYGINKYNVELSIWHSYNDMLEVKIKRIHIQTEYEFEDCTDDLSSTKDVQGIGRMIRHEIYAIVKSFK